MRDVAAQHGSLTSNLELGHSVAKLLHLHKGPPMPPSELQPKRVIALCAALQGIGGGLGWSVLPPLMQPISAEPVGAPALDRNQS